MVVRRILSTRKPVMVGLGMPIAVAFDIPETKFQEAQIYYGSLGEGPRPAARPGTRVLRCSGPDLHPRLPS